MGLWKSFWRTGAGRYTKNLLISVDQLGNTLWGGNPDETISSRLGRIKQKHGGAIPWWRPLPKLIDHLLDVIDPNHSIDAIEWDENPANGCFDKHFTMKDREKALEVLRTIQARQQQRKRRPGPKAQPESNE